MALGSADRPIRAAARPEGPAGAAAFTRASTSAASAPPAPSPRTSPAADPASSATAAALTRPQRAASSASFSRSRPDDDRGRSKKESKMSSISDQVIKGLLRRTAVPKTVP